MVGKRIFELFPIEKKLVWPNQALGRHIGFWWITQNATRCQPGTARDLHLEPIWNTNHQKPGGGGSFLKVNFFFNGPASVLIYKTTADVCPNEDKKHIHTHVYRWFFLFSTRLTCHISPKNYPISKSPGIFHINIKCAIWWINWFYKVIVISTW